MTSFKFGEYGKFLEDLSKGKKYDLKYGLNDLSCWKKTKEHNQETNQQLLREFSRAKTKGKMDTLENWKVLKTIKGVDNWI